MRPYKPKNARKRWTAEEWEWFGQMLMRGESKMMIAIKLERSFGAIKRALYRTEKYYKQRTD